MKLNLKKDVIFKAFFARKGNEEFLIDFLNSLLHTNIKTIEIEQEELPKFRKQNPDMNEKLNQWLAFIDNYDRRLVEMAESKNKVLKKARKEMEYLTGDAAIERLEFLKEKWEMDYNSGISDARSDGEKIGEARGKKKSQLKIAKEMLKNGIALDAIVNCTGLTKKEIEEIKKN